MPRFSPILPLALAILAAPRAARADCELLYAPPEVRARLLAFHHANEQRRAREQAGRDKAEAAPRARPRAPAKAAEANRPARHAAPGQ